MNTPLDLQAALAAAHAAHAGLSEGAPASYIPDLASADLEAFGLAGCPLSGAAAEAGDADRAFTLQSLSKPFVYALALDRLGLAAVHERVGVEPTGDPFDSIVRLEGESRLPHNPMVNAGAIAVTGLLLETGLGLDELLEFLGACAGRPALPVDVPIWLSEREAAHRNRAIAHLMRHFGALVSPVQETLDLYFRQCAAVVDCRALAVMAATLAGHGVCRLSGERVLSREASEHTLAVLSTCGLYDATGRFLFEVGLPAKSGVSGGLLAIAPGRVGLAGFSARLDRDGNSVRARAAVADVCQRLSLHSFEVGRGAEPRPTFDASRLRASLEAALEQAVDSGEGEPSPLVGGERERLGLAIACVDGTEVQAGDARVPFALQAVCNALAYAYVRNAVGRGTLSRIAGLEPSGNPFHAILFDPRTQLPYNPLGSAGAIGVASLAPGATGTARLRGLLGFLSAAAGAPLAVDAADLDAEVQAGERNRAIAALLSGSGGIGNEEAALQLYWQQCCVHASAVELARIGATLASGGVRPDGERALDTDAVRDTLVLMYTCGQHDGSGRFAFEVGLPAKSGISGGLLAVVPGRMGIAAWSPAVDSRGTSVRGFAALRALSRDLDLAVFSEGAPGRRSPG